MLLQQTQFSELAVAEVAAVAVVVMSAVLLEVAALVMSGVYPHRLCFLAVFWQTYQ